MIDSINRQILHFLQEDARISNAEIARRLKLAPSGILERLRKLEAKGVIEKYETRVNPKAAGKPILAFLFVKNEARTGPMNLGKELAKIPDVLEVHAITGEHSYLLKIRVSSVEDIGEFFTKKMAAHNFVFSTVTSVVIKTLKESLGLDL